MPAEYKNETTGWIDIAAEIPAISGNKFTIQCKRYQIQAVSGGAEPATEGDGVTVDRDLGLNVENTAVWVRGDRGIHIGYTPVV